MADTLLAQGDVANDSEDNSQRKHGRQKKKTEGVAQPQTGEGETTETVTAEAEHSGSGAEARAKTGTGGKSPAKAPVKRASAKSASVKRAAPKRASAARSAPKEACEATRATVVKKLLRNIEEKLSGKDVKASLGDYIRLVQLQKELDEEAPREIKVTWVEPGTKTTGKKSDKGSESGA